LDESKLFVNLFILGVTHLCARTRELAESRPDGPFALLPIRESLDLLRRTVDELDRSLEVAAARSSPEGADAAEPEGSWLMDPSEVL
jgi:hypothetical protein